MLSLKDDKLVVFRADEDLEDDEQKKTDCLNLFLFAWYWWLVFSKMTNK